MQSEIHAQNVYLLFISRILTLWSHLPLLRPLKVAVQEHKPWLRVWTKAQVGRWVQLTSQRPYTQMGTHSSFQSISQGSFWFCPLLHLYIHIKKKKTHPILQKNKLLLQGVASSYSWEFSEEILVGFGCLTSPNSFGNPSLVVLWGGIKTASEGTQPRQQPQTGRDPASALLVKGQLGAALLPAGSGRRALSLAPLHLLWSPLKYLGCLPAGRVPEALMRLQLQSTS